MRVSQFLLLVCVLVLSGCAAPQSDPPRELPEAYASHGITSTARGSAGLDHNILPGPVEVAEILPIVLTGQVVAVHEGPAFYSTGLTDYYSFVEIQVDELIKGKEDTEKHTTYVLINSGAASTDDQGVEVPLKEGESYSKLTPSELSQAFPVGVKATVMGYYTSLQPPVDDAVSIRSGVEVPQDALLIGPDPQGFILEGRGHTAISMNAVQTDIEQSDWPTGDNAFTKIVSALEEAAAAGELD